MENNGYKGELPTNEERFIYKHGLALASTLDALVAENARLVDELGDATANLELDVLVFQKINRENIALREAAIALKVATDAHELHRDNVTWNAMRNAQVALEKSTSDVWPPVASAQPIKTHPAN